MMTPKNSASARARTHTPHARLHLELLEDRLAPAVGNPGFENGTTHWSMLTGGDFGTRASLAGSPSVEPLERTQFALLTSKGTTATTGFSPFGTAGVAGTIVESVFTANANQSFSFGWNFLTNEEVTNTTANDDFALGQLLDANGSVLQTLFAAHVRSGAANFTQSNLDPLSFPRFVTGWQSASFSVTNPGSYKLRFVVSDATDSSRDSGLALDAFSPGNSNPTNLTLNGGSVNEGSSFTLTGNFLDADDGDSHRVTIDWGDGTPHTILALPAALNSDTTNFSSAHVYSDNGTRTVTVTVADSFTAQVVNTTTVSVGNVAPTATIDGAPASVPEGTPIALTSTVSDPGPLDTFTYSWTVTKNGLAFSSGTANNFRFTPSDNGTYLVALLVTDDDGGVASQSKTIAVTNVVPTVVAGPDTTILLENRLVRTVSFVDPGMDTWTATVDYGDGSGAQPVSLTGKTFTLSHQYTALGAFTVTVSVADGSGALGTDSVAVTVKPVPANVLFVRQLYLDLLSRQADSGGETMWVRQLDSGESRLVVARGIQQSLESLGKRVNAIYQSILNRSADLGGRTYWVGLLQSGMDEQAVQRAFYLSTEYQASRASHSTFLSDLYASILGRTPDSAGLSSWIDRLQSGTSRADVVQSFQSSAEAHSVNVDRLFRLFLDRGLDRLRAGRWVNRLAFGHSTLTEVAAGILASDEYLHESVLTPNRTPSQSPTPIGDGVADDTAAIQSLLDRASVAGGEVRLGPGRYRITSTLLIEGDGVNFLGEGGAVLVGDGEGFAMVRVNHPTRRLRNVRIAGLAFDSLTARKSGAGIDIANCLNTFVERCWIERQAVGVVLHSCRQSYVSDTSIREITPVLGIGILIDGGNDQYLRDLRIVGHLTEPSLQPDCGVSILATGGIWMDNVGTIKAGTGLRICPPRGNVVEFLFSSQCSYDMGTGHGILIGGEGGSVRSLYSQNDWASSNGLDGVHVREAADVRFQGMRCYNNRAHGMQLAGSDFLLDGCTCSGNGVLAAPNYHGIVLNRVNGARVVNCRSGQVAHFGNHQGYGLFVASASASELLFDNNDFRSNLTGGMHLMGSYQVGLNSV